MVDHEYIVEKAVGGECVTTHTRLALKTLGSFLQSVSSKIRIYWILALLFVRTRDIACRSSFEQPKSL